MSLRRIRKRPVVGDFLVTKSQVWFAQRNKAKEFIETLSTDYPMSVVYSLYESHYGHKLTKQHKMLLGIE